MASCKGNHYYVHYNDEDDLSLRFVEVLIRKTSKWGFDCSKEKLGVTKLDQLNENERNTYVAIVVISPNQTSLTKRTGQMVLNRSIVNNKRIIPICLQGAESDDFKDLISLKFKTEQDWNNSQLWERLKTNLEEICCPDTMNSPDTDKSAHTARSPTNNDGFITDKRGCEIAKRVVDVWWKLAIRLGLEPCSISEIEKNNEGNVCEMARQMLMRWRQSSRADTEHEQIAILYQCLTAEKQNDLAHEIHNAYKDSGRDSSKIVTKVPEVVKTISNDIFLLELSEKLPDWKHVFLKLDVDDHRLQTLATDYHDTHRRTFQAFLLWRSEHGDKSDEINKNEIVRILQQDGRLDIVEWMTASELCDQFEPVHLSSDKTSLDEACSKLGRTAPEFQTECERICEEFKRQGGVKRVWPAYAYTKDSAESEDRITFIVIRESSDVGFDDKGYRCEIRLSGTISDACKAENTAIRKQEMIDNAPYRLDEIMAHINKTRETETLMQNHKHLSRITASRVRSIGFKSKNPVMKKEGCIALYVPVKGFIPLDEEPFPDHIRGYPVDVREGIIM